MGHLFPDRFVLLLLASLLLAWLLPVHGSVLAVMQSGIFAGIFLLFFLHGLRLPREEVTKAARGWRVQAAMVLFCFGIMPIAGWTMAHLVADALPVKLVAGIIFLTVVPSTVQSAISYSSIGGGNVAASVVGAALSNLAAIILTPMLSMLLIGGIGGIALDTGIILKIATMLLLPFALGQSSQRWFGAWASRQKSVLSVFDRAIILLAVYIAFTGAVASGAMIQVTGSAMLTLCMAVAILLALAFGGATLMGRLLRLGRTDRISLIFAGAHKSIATGVPMAALLFGQHAGLVVLPLILYHIAQLVISAPVAARLSRGTSLLKTA